MTATMSKLMTAVEFLMVGALLLLAAVAGFGLLVVAGALLVHAQMWTALLVVLLVLLTVLVVVVRSCQLCQLCQLAKEVEAETESADAGDGLPRGKDGRVLWFACTDQQLAAHALRSGKTARAEVRLEKIMGTGVELVEWAPGKWFAARPAGAVWVELVEGRTDLQLMQAVL
jgi:hypothetical protein